MQEFAPQFIIGYLRQNNCISGGEQVDQPLAAFLDLGQGIRMSQQTKDAGIEDDTPCHGRRGLSAKYASSNNCCNCSHSASVACCVAGLSAASSAIQDVKM